MTDPPEQVTTLQLTITESHVVSWAGLTGDWLPLHMSSEYAARSRFGRRVVHGPLTQALAIGLGTRTAIVDPERTVAWLGLRDVRALAPVFVDDTIQVHITRTAARTTTRGDGRVVDLRYDVVNQHGTTVMSFVNILLEGNDAGSG